MYREYLYLNGNNYELYLNGDTCTYNGIMILRQLEKEGGLWEGHLGTSGDFRGWFSLFFFWFVHTIFLDVAFGHDGRIEMRPFHAHHLLRVPLALVVIHRLLRDSAPRSPSLRGSRAALAGSFSWSTLFLFSKTTTKTIIRIIVH